VRDCSYDREQGKFNIRAFNSASGTEMEEQFDNVVCCTGHFSTPNVPDFEGLDTFTGRALHAHDFRDAEQFKDQHILVIGTSYSAEDIASQCYKYGVKSVTLSWRSNPMSFSWPDNFRTVPLLQKVSGRTCTFKDGTSVDVDAIIFCTGYKHHFPFMRPDLQLKTANRLYPDSLYEGVVWPSNPGMFYLGMQDQWLTFNMFDAQAWYVRDVILGRIALPDRAAMERKWATWRAKEENLESTDEACIRFQADYVKHLIQQTDYPLFDIEGVIQAFLDWEHHKHENIMTFRDKSHRSVMTGTMAPKHHTPWLKAFDDSIDCYVNENRKSTDSHLAVRMPFPGTIPDGFTQDPTEPAWDPSVHLQLEAPSFLKTLTQDSRLCNWSKFPAPAVLEDEDEFPGLACSAPFRILSDEGVRVIREIVNNNEINSHTFERTPKLLRGLAYRSKFIRDFLYSEEVFSHMEKMSRTPMNPHGVLMHGAQINFGVGTANGGSDRPVDDWHLDSVPYVLVVLLSDAAEFEGGETKIARYRKAEDAVQDIKNKAIPNELVETLRLPGAGYAMLMQGSKVPHKIMPVTKGLRLSLVNSYMSRDVFEEDRTFYRLSKIQDPGHVHPVEIARHYAWRVQGQLDYLLQENMWGKTDKVLQILDDSSEELKRTHRLITGTLEEQPPY
jgi:trimethylamine monooxygenase